MRNKITSDSIGQDLRFGLRLLRKNQAFTVAVILTLGLGIGANTAIFSVVNAVLLKPLPYPDADHLAILWSGLGDAQRAPASAYELFQIRQRSRLFDQVGGIWVTNGQLPGEGEPEQVKVGIVTANFLSLLCHKPELGRLFSAQDESANRSSAVILSHGVWARRFGADPDIIGKAVRLGDGALTVVGVLPESFRLIFPDDSSVPPNVELFFPLQADYTQPGGPSFLRLVGHLRGGVSFAQAQAEADSIASQLRAMDQNFRVANLQLHVFPLQQDDVRNLRPALLLLFGGVGFVLLIACANVAHLLLAKMAPRQRELTVRAAFGAGPSRLVCQLLTEGVLLGVLGGAAGLIMGWSALRAFLIHRPESLARLGSIHLDHTVLGFTFAVAVLTGILFSVAPAIGASRLDLISNLRESARTITFQSPGLRNLMIAGEVCLGFALLAGTGLLVRTFVNLLRVDPGFRPDNVLTFQVSGADYQFFHQLQQNLLSLPGSQSASLVSHLPLDDSYPNWYDSYWSEGAPAERQNTSLADHRSILPGYFRTIGAVLLKGRDFSDSDDAAHQHVAIVDEVLAQELWPGQDPLGKKLNLSDSPAGPYQFQRDCAVVVGVVKHVQYHSLSVMVRPQIYVPFQLAPRPASFVLRTSAPLAGLAQSVRNEVHKLNPGAAVGHLLPLSEFVVQARSQAAFVALLAGALASIALFLACVGIYGVTSQSVSQKTREIGIRMAVGAGWDDILGLVLRQGMVPVIQGLAAGLALSFALAPLLSSLLFGVKPGDPATFGVILALLFGSGVLACYFPARRATRLDPLKALRYE
jgi:putative ABC transport system permease protein